MQAGTASASLTAGSTAYDTSPLSFLDELARRIFSLVCHQRPDRCLGFGGEAMPLCARCTGVYVGFGLALACLLLSKHRNSSRFLSKSLLILVALCFVAMPLQVVVEWLGGSFSNEFRFLVGLFGGAAFAALMFPIFNYFRARPRAKQVSAWGGQELIIIALCSLVVWFLFTSVLRQTDVGATVLALTALAGLGAMYFVTTFTVLLILLRKLKSPLARGDSGVCFVGSRASCSETPK